jgi:hypothetical protein
MGLVIKLGEKKSGEPLNYHKIETISKPVKGEVTVVVAGYENFGERLTNCPSGGFSEFKFKSNEELDEDEVYGLLKKTKEFKKAISTSEEYPEE